MLTVTAPEVNVHIPILKMEPCSSWVAEPRVRSAAHLYYYKDVRRV